MDPVSGPAEIVKGTPELPSLSTVARYILVALFNAPFSKQS